MKKARKLLWSRRARLGVMALALVLTMGFAVEHFSFVSHAESQGKITASSSVNIRKEANSSSSVVGSAEKGATIDIRGQATASDGTVWYQVFVDANTLGYIRSDLVQITDGSTPPKVEATVSTPASETTTSTTNETTTSSSTTVNTNETPVAVTAIQPLSATVTNGEKVRVRSNASTTSSIVTSVQSGMALTVTGQATGTDGNVWYQVEFIDNGANVVGFIRSDYVALSGEVVPVSAETPETTTPEESVQTEEPVETKTWETQLQGEKWYLLNMDTNNQWVIDDLFSAVETNGNLYETSQKTVKSQKIAIIILVILLVAVAAVATLLFLKIKDMMDSAYFSEVEKETLRRRGESGSKNGQKVVHTVGPDKKQGSRPTGARPAGAQPQGARPAGAQPQGARPAGTRPAGAQPQGTRPAGTQPQGARPAGTQPQGTRPAGAQPQGARPAGAQPQGTRPAGAQSQGTRPAGAQPQGTRPAGAQPQSARPATAQPQSSRPADTVRPADTQQNPGWKSKNFMTDDEEFEFEFLHWDGEEE